MPCVEIQPMQPTELHAAARVLSYAMLNNPIHIAVYQQQDERVRQRIKAGFIEVLQKRSGTVVLAKVATQIIGVYRSKLCGGKRVLSPAIQELIKLPNPVFSVFQEREKYWHGIWASRDPAVEHSHLGPIGVLPEFQHCGVGTQLMQHYCQAIEAQGLAAYLEADKAQNVSFYQQFGFRVVDETDILGVRNYFMWRADPIE